MQDLNIQIYVLGRISGSLSVIASLNLDNTVDIDNQEFDIKQFVGSLLMPALPVLDDDYIQIRAYSKYRSRNNPTFPINNSLITFVSNGLRLENYHQGQYGFNSQTVYETTLEYYNNYLLNNTIEAHVTNVNSIHIDRLLSDKLTVILDTIPVDGFNQF